MQLIKLQRTRQTQHNIALQQLPRRLVLAPSKYNKVVLEPVSKTISLQISGVDYRPPGTGVGRRSGPGGNIPDLEERHGAPAALEGL